VWSVCVYGNYILIIFPLLLFLKKNKASNEKYEFGASDIKFHHEKGPHHKIKKEKIYIK